MDTRRRIVAVLLAALLVGAAPAVAAIATYSVPIENEVPVTTDQTPTVVLASPGGPTDVNMQDLWGGSELDIRTSEGNITVSGDPGASARLAVSDIEGTQTQVTEISAGSSWLNLNPADKQRVDVRGDADTLAFKSVSVDDGNTDLQLGGPQGGTAELRIHDLSAGTSYALYDSSRDEVLGYGTADSGGTLQTTVDMPDGTQALEVRTAGTFAQPTVSNPDPTGTVTSRPQNLSVDVTADAWPATVNFTLEGQDVGSVTMTSNGTATTSVTVDDLGTYNWSATVTDGVGTTDTVDASFETPSNVTIREETRPQTIVNNSTVTLRFYTTDGEIAIERTADNGTVDMSGLPDSEFVVFVESPNHYDRRVYIESIYEQENIYLLNETRHPRGTNDAIRSRFLYEDLTGNFPRGSTTIEIQRAIDLTGNNESRYRTIAGDYWGASNEFESVLEYGERYRIVLVNRETGARHVAGAHVPTEDLTQTIRVSGLVVDAKNASGVVAIAEYNSDAEAIEWAYDDPTGQTDAVTVVVSERGNASNELYNQTIDGPHGSVSDSVALNESQQEQSWVVTVESDRHRVAIPVGAGSVPIPFPMPGWVLTLFMSMAVTFVGALYGPRTALLGAWAMVFVAAGVAMFGWAFSPASVVVAALVAVGMTLLERALP